MDYRVKYIELSHMATIKIRAFINQAEKVIKLKDRLEVEKDK